MHEDYSREHEVRLGSDRSFGFTIAAALAVIGALPMYRHHPPRVGLLVASIVLACVAFAKPSLLHGLNRLWSRLGLALNRVTSPVLLAIVYCLAVVPTGLAMRLAGKDPMRRRRNSTARSYWIARESPPTSMTQQF
jgi:saxitoxin biosynthesis operon SxtJ-like protein